MAGDWLDAIDEALRAGWQLHISGADKLVTVQVFKPDVAFAWATIPSINGIFDALARAGRAIREVLS